ncbi:MAG: hypothetical protein ACRBCI_04250 [Cellvibrionaceae bacterium]
MLERQRQQYLSALGIENYIPRRVLPGAALSNPLPDHLLQAVDYTSNEAIAHTLTTENVPVSQEEITDKLNNITEGIGNTVSPLEALVKKESEQPEKITPPTVTREQQVQTNNADAKSDTQESINFVLNSWQIGEACLVIDTRQPGAALPTDALLLNILRALGYSLVQLPQSEIIRWPLFVNQNIKADNDAAQARAMVQAYITAKTTKASIQHILLMGKSSADFSLDVSSDFSDLNGTFIESSQWAARIAVTPSLVTMLEDPLQKRVAWQALKGLIQ